MMMVEWCYPTENGEQTRTGIIKFVQYAYSFNKEDTKGTWRLLVLSEGALYDVDYSEVIIVGTGKNVH